MKDHLTAILLGSLIIGIISFFGKILYSYYLKKKKEYNFSVNYSNQYEIVQRWGANYNNEIRTPKELNTESFEKHLLHKFINKVKKSKK